MDVRQWIRALRGPHLGATLVAYAGAVGAGALMAWPRAPLPWMLGPMIFVGLLCFAGWKVLIPRISRPVAQATVAGSVGLSFTPAATLAVSQQILPMLAVALMATVSGLLVASLLMRISRMDVVTAVLSSIPGGAIEMAELAMRYGGAPGPVAFAQTLRVSLLVLTVPSLVVLANGHPPDPFVLAAAEVDYGGVALLMGLVALGAMLFRGLRVSNPFFLGPLAVAALASALLLPVAPPPYWVLAAAQIVLGVWLGSMFQRETLKLLGGYVPAILLSTVVLLCFCAATAIGISFLTGIGRLTMLLATAPGGMTEMALTAKFLQQGVAMVTAFHVVRVFVTLPLTPLVVAAAARLVRRRSIGKGRAGSGGT